MPAKQIENALQAWTAGASWSVLTEPTGQNTIVHMLNATGVTLYEGDIVSIDVTGSQALIMPATLASGFGVVGGEAGANISVVSPGGPFPPQAQPARNDAATVTSGSATVTDASIKATDLGRAVVTNGTGTAVFPAGTVIVTVTAGTSFVASNAATGGGTNTQVGIFDAPAGIGPGWFSTAQFAAGQEVPIVQLSGNWGKINITGQTTTVAGDLLIPTSASLAATRVASGAATAAQIGFGMAVALEAYAARDLSLTNAGITGHETIRAIIKSF